MKYKVLWMDDKCKESSHLNYIMRARKVGIELIGFENADDGLENFKLNPSFYDAILLDGLFYLNNSDKGDNVSESALQTVLSALYNYSIPKFVLSGQTSFTDTKNPVIENNIQIVGLYKKSNEDDLNRLWEDIKNKANEIEVVKLKQKYSRVFKITEEKYLGSSSFESLLKLVYLLESDSEYAQTKDDFISIRKFTEIIIDKLFDLNLIPLDIKGNHNKVIRFICSEQTNYLHPTLSFVLTNMNELLQDSSHNKITLKYKVDEFTNESKSPYIFKSLVFQLFEFLIWYKDFVDLHPNPIKNKDLLIANEDSSSESTFYGKLKTINEEWNKFISIEGIDFDIPKFVIDRYPRIDIDFELEVTAEITEVKGRKNYKTLKIKTL